MNGARKTTAHQQTDPHVWLLGMLHELKNRGYYGKLEISFEAGRMVHLEKRESLKPPR